MATADTTTSIVGDLPGFGEEAYFDEDAAYYEDDAAPQTGYADADFQDDQTVVAPAGHYDAPSGRSQSVVQRTPNRQNMANQYAPVSASSMQPVSHEIMMSDMSMSHTVSGDCGCGTTSCGGGCGTGSSCAPRHNHRKICDIFDRCDSNMWMGMETLLWFVQPRDTAPLIVESNGGTLPFLGEPSARTVFGGNTDTDLSVGFRGDMGVWLSDNVGVGGRFWIIDSSGEDYSNASNGDNLSIGRSFFDPELPGESGLIVAFDGVFQGSIQAESELDMLGAEAYARMKIGCSKNAQLNLIGGYSHFQIDDSLRISSTTLNESATGGNPIGTNRFFSDDFDIDNEFNGGQVGFDMVMQRGRWTVSSLTKVHMGNMSQSLDFQGFNTRTVPGVAPTTQSGGVLAPVGGFSANEDVFSFIPEANFKMAYKFRKNVSLSVGYSFLYFDNVALVGDNLIRNIDASSIGTGVAGTNPNYTAGNIEDSGLWVQGIDLGFVIDF